MIHCDDYICPRCGLLCPTLTAFHHHYAQEHQQPTQSRGVANFNSTEASNHLSSPPEEVSLDV